MSFPAPKKAVEPWRSALIRLPVPRWPNLLRSTPTIVIEAEACELDRGPVGAGSNVAQLAQQLDRLAQSLTALAGALAQLADSLQQLSRMMERTLELTEQLAQHTTALQRDGS